MSPCLSGVRPSEIAPLSQTAADLRRINPRAKRNGKSGSLTNAHASRTASTVRIAIRELSNAALANDRLALRRKPSAAEDLMRRFEHGETVEVGYSVARPSASSNGASARGSSKAPQHR